MKRARLDLAGAWHELQRRRVVRLGLWYIAFGVAAIQAADVLLGTFEQRVYMPWVVGVVATGFPIALILSWFFDMTPQGIERTAAQPEPRAHAPDREPPAGSLAVLPFANLSDDPDNEYFSDGLAEEIRNELARTPGLRVAARTSSFMFKNRPEDVRSIARRLDVAAVLEGGVRRHADTVRIYLQLVGARDGYQLWSANFERRLEDIFALQSEVACAVARAVAPLSAAAPALPKPENFEAYNLYLRGRHHFHKRTEASLRRAVECFEQALAIDANYALAWSGLADARILQSARFYGNLSLDDVLAKAGPAAERALALAPQLGEAHATMGLLRTHQNELAAAAESFERARALAPGYPMGLVWAGLNLVKQGRFREAEECDAEAFRIDPLSPIVNANVAFDRLRYGDVRGARERFEAAIEIDPSFPVPHYGLARVALLEGDEARALEQLDAAIRCAPQRAYYRARKGVLLLQMGRLDDAGEVIDEACCISPDNSFDADLRVALAIARGDRAKLASIVDLSCGCDYKPPQRAQAALALDDRAQALALYDQAPPDRKQELIDLVTDDWVWRAPHTVNHAHLRLRAGDARGRTELEALLSDLEALARAGVVNPQANYWAASVHSVLGRADAAQRELRHAAGLGWRHDWWHRVDWNLQGARAEVGA